MRCHQFNMTVNTAHRADPSQTTMLRARFISDVNRRWNALLRDTRISIINNDCFGIQPDVLRTFSPLPTKAFEFVRTPQKVSLFMEWLQLQEDAGILQIIRRPGFGVESAWSDVYIESAYAKGIRKGYTELNKAGYQTQLPLGGVRAAMAHPIHADRVGIIYSRTFEDLKSVTSVTNAQTRRLIAEGLTSGLARGVAEGKNPRMIARELYKDVANRVDKIGKVRARMIARTEVLNAHNEALHAQYELTQTQLGELIFVDISLGANPCPICIDLESGGPYPLDVSRGLVPAHPNCVCIIIPVRRKRKAA